MNNQTKYAYAVKHKRTGFYYCSSKYRSRTHVKSFTTNLRERMTLYTKKPRLSHYYSYSDENGFRVINGSDDFEIETFILVKQ